MNEPVLKWNNLHPQLPDAIIHKTIDNKVYKDTAEDLVGFPSSTLLGIIKGPNIILLLT